MRIDKWLTSVITVVRDILTYEAIHAHIVFVLYKTNIKNYTEHQNKRIVPPAYWSVSRSNRPDVTIIQIHMQNFKVVYVRFANIWIMCACECLCKNCFEIHYTFYLIYRVWSCIVGFHCWFYPIFQSEYSSEKTLSTHNGNGNIICLL